MKIIGKADSTFIATVTEDEVAILLGFRSTYDEGYKGWLHDHLKTKSWGSSNTIPVGTEIQVKPLGDFMRTVLSKEAEMKTAAKTLHALGDLITTNLPSGIILPPAPEKEPEA